MAVTAGTSEPRRIRVLGVPVDVVTMDDALAWVDAQIGKKARRTIIAVNPEKIMRIRHDASMLRFFESASLLIPDGIGVVFAARLLGLARMERVPGSELMPLVCARAAERGYRVFVFGAQREVNEQAVAVLCAGNPGLRIVGQQDGYLRESQMHELLRRINESGADILFVGLGSPRQELWMERYLPGVQVSVCQGVGGTLDVLAGRVTRAPAPFRRMHLEWAIRLLSEPKRLGRQTALPRFAVQVLLQATRRRLL